MTAEEQVRQWNERHPPGAPVYVWRDNGTVTETYTREKAMVMSCSAVVWLAGISGYYSLERVRPRTVTFDARERDKLMESVPEYYHEAQALYPGLLPPKTEDVDDAWRNRTTAENACWLIETLRALVEQERSGQGQLLQMVGGYGEQLGVEPPPWDGRTERRQAERRGTGDRRREDRLWPGGGLRQITEGAAGDEKGQA